MKFDRSNISPEEFKSIKESFFHVYHSFLNEGFISKNFVGCLFKWGIQLHITEAELKYLNPENEIAFTETVDKEKGIQHLYNLVYMIYLDGVVEDIELEVVSKYAQKINFQPHIVNDLLKTIVTAPSDGFDFNHVKSHLKDLLEVAGNQND